MGVKIAGNKSDQAELLSKIKKTQMEIVAKESELSADLQKLAEMQCPFKVGDLITTDRGLGKNGLKVFEVSYSKYWSWREGAIWVLNTFALTKAGEVSKRAVEVSPGDNPVLHAEEK